MGALTCLGTTLDGLTHDGLHVAENADVKHRSASRPVVRSAAADPPPGPPPGLTHPSDDDRQDRSRRSRDSRPMHHGPFADAGKRRGRMELTVGLLWAFASTQICTVSQSLPQFHISNRRSVSCAVRSMYRGQQKFLMMLCRSVGLLLVLRIAPVASMQNELETRIAELLLAETDFVLNNGSSMASAEDAAFPMLAAGPGLQDHPKTGGLSEPVVRTAMDLAAFAGSSMWMMSSAVQPAGTFNVTAAEGAEHVQDALTHVPNRTANVSKRSAHVGRENMKFPGGETQELFDASGSTYFLVTPFNRMSTLFSRRFALAPVILSLLVFILIFGLLSEGDEGGLYKRALSRLESASRTSTTAMASVAQDVTAFFSCGKSFRPAPTSFRPAPRA